MESITITCMHSTCRAAPCAQIRSLVGYAHRVSRADRRTAQGFKSCGKTVRPLKPYNDRLLCRSFPEVECLVTKREELLGPLAAGYDTGDLLADCEASKPRRVAALLSGGVDSSVALSLALAAGHDVEAFYIQIWFQEDFRNTWGACPWEAELQECQKLCEHLGDIPLHVVRLTDQYWSLVVNDCIRDVREGRTPNPDVLCNSRIKFGAFLEWLETMHPGRFEAVVSGHYAWLERAHDGLHLIAAADPLKDQTYFLSQLSAQQLQRCLFPLGHLTKVQVREVAHRLRLPNAARPESQGLCFLGHVQFSEFIQAHLGEWPGPIVEHETGKIMGYHPGFWFFTLGQRKGIRLSGGPWYVTEKDTRRNIIRISRKYHEEPEANRHIFLVGDLLWHEDPASLPVIDGEAGVFHFSCKTRHGPEMNRATLRVLPGKDEHSEAIVRLIEPDQGLAPGQFAVFYTEQGVCCASGVIQGFPGRAPLIEPSP